MKGTPVSPDESSSWVFVSHSSEDLPAVRRVRNYLEEQGAAPLLFHLRSLTAPEDFWPIIEREIRARNFFLYCDSPAASRSEWVRRERDFVKQIAKERGIRVGHINVSGDETDTQRLDRFLADWRVFPIFSRVDAARVAPYVHALELAGFRVFRESPIRPSNSWTDTIAEELKDASATGWVVLFYSHACAESRFARWERSRARSLGARLVVVGLDDDMDPGAWPELSEHLWYTLEPHELVSLLLRLDVKPD